MNPSDTITIKSIYNLIEYSSDFRFKRRANFKQLHTSLIKDFFNTTSVVLDVDNHTVCLGIDMLEKGTEVCIKFDDLEKFLKSCVRPTEEKLPLYKNILHYYTRTEAVA